MDYEGFYVFGNLDPLVWKRVVDAILQTMRPGEARFGCIYSVDFDGDGMFGDVYTVRRIDGAGTFASLMDGGLDRHLVIFEEEDSSGIPFCSFEPSTSEMAAGYIVASEEDARDENDIVAPGVFGRPPQGAYALAHGKVYDLLRPAYIGERIADAVADVETYIGIFEHPGASATGAADAP